MSELEDSIIHEIPDTKNSKLINAYCAKDVFKEEVKKENPTLEFKRSMSKKYIEVSFIRENIRYSALFTKQEVRRQFGHVEVIE